MVEDQYPTDDGHNHGDPAPVGSDRGPRHAHTHGAVDPSLLTTERGIWAIKWSFRALFATAICQGIVVLVSGSVALLADTIHNLGDAATAIPLCFSLPDENQLSASPMAMVASRISRVCLSYRLFYSAHRCCIRIHRQNPAPARSEIYLGCRRRIAAGLSW